MKDRLQSPEGLPQEIVLDAAAYSAAYVLDAVKSPVQTQEDFDKYLSFQRHMSGSHQHLGIADQGQEIAIEYMRNEYFERLKDLAAQLTHVRFKNAYQLPWSILGRALMAERSHRYHTLAGSQKSVDVKRSAHFPIVLTQLPTVPGEMDMMDAITQISENSVAMLATGDLSKVISSIEGAIAHEYGYPEDVPQPTRRGNLIKVDFEYFSKFGNRGTYDHNAGLTSAMRDLYLLGEYLDEKRYGGM